MTAFGLLNIDKPQGVTSHDVVAIARRGTHIKKIGHAGTLDPMATGVLILCIGNATRLSEYAMNHQKSYHATVHLGVETDTYDAEGAVVSTNDTMISREQVEAVLSLFRGDINQIPPMYSAIKKGGKKLYELAREGKTLDLDARPVTIDKLEILRWDYPEFDIQVDCSPGTYIRSLAFDIGQAVDVGAHLSALRRVRSGTFSVDEGVTLETLREAMDNDDWQRYLLPADLAVQDLPRLDLDDNQAKIIESGGFLERSNSEVAIARAYDSAGEFFAILEPRENHPDLWKPRKVFR